MCTSTVHSNVHKSLTFWMRYTLVISVMAKFNFPSSHCEEYICVSSSDHVLVTQWMNVCHSLPSTSKLYLDYIIRSKAPPVVYTVKPSSVCCGSSMYSRVKLLHTTGQLSIDTTWETKVLLHEHVHSQKLWFSQENFYGFYKKTFSS